MTLLWKEQKKTKEAKINKELQWTRQFQCQHWGEKKTPHKQNYIYIYLIILTQEGSIFHDFQTF